MGWSCIRFVVLIGVASGAIGVEAITDAIRPYEPVYLLLQPDLMRAKFQVSFAVRLIGDPAPVEGRELPTPGVFIGYSQSNTWNLHDNSRPIDDGSFRPEAWYRQPVPVLPWEVAALDLGVSHESNGLAGAASRSFNAIFLRATGTVALAPGWSFDGAPRLRTYVGDLSDNPDIAEYRGYFDLIGGLDAPGGWRGTVATHLGSQWDRATVQLDLTYPLAACTGHWVKAYLDVQFFDGWGETLRGYKQHSQRGMVGIAFVR